MKLLLTIAMATLISGCTMKSSCPHSGSGECPMMKSKCCSGDVTCATCPTCSKGKECAHKSKDCSGCAKCSGKK